MRWLVILALWVVAVVVAVMILRRVRRGKPVVLTGTWSPRVVRMIAVVLVVLGVGDEARMPETTAAPAKLPVRSTDDDLPKAITAETIRTWLILHQQGGDFAMRDAALARALASGKPPAVVLGNVAGPPGGFGGGPGGAGMGLPATLRKLIDADLAALQ